MEEYKVGICIAYDWEFLEFALPPIYPYVDVICLSIDKDRKSWNKKTFSFDQGKFYAFIDQIDVDSKIKILEDDFHLEQLSPMQNEVRQRNMMADFLGKGGWHIQIDCDEYFVDFLKFKEKLASYPIHKDQRVNFCCPLVTLFKSVDSGFLYVDAIQFEKVEYIAIATRMPNYEFGRKNGFFNFYTDNYLLHQSWARDASEVKNKLDNWGHYGDFSAAEFFNFWNDLSVHNYKSFINFHPINREIWHSLNLIEGTNVPILIEKIRGSQLFPITRQKLMLKNNRNLARVKSLVNKMFR